MAGKQHAGFAPNRFNPREQKAFCDGMAHRLADTAANNPITDNPFDNTNVEGDNEIAWDAGWNAADGDAGGALDPLNCALEGTVAA